MRRRLWGVVCALALVGCSDAEDGNDGASLFVVPDDLALLSEESFFDHPWPSDFRRDADGTLHVAGYPNPRFKPILEEYIDSMAGVLPGFSPVAAGYLRFRVAVDPASLPADPLASVDASSSVQLIDVDPASPQRGTRRLIDVRFIADPGVYWAENTLAWMPALGHPLRPNTRYAAVVTRSAQSAKGSALTPSPTLREVLGLEPARGARKALASAWADAIDELDAVGVARSQIAHLAVFTTDDPMGDAAAIRDWVVSGYPAPVVRPGTWVAKDQVATVMDVYEATYGPSPDFQAGDIPFANAGDGGALSFDASGTPVVQREFDLRFALAVPALKSCPMPAAGYPIVLYAHGTGGNYRSMIGGNREAQALAKRCIATMGIDQIFHGTRPGAGKGNVEVLFFNVQNPIAARANGPQSAIDVVQQARLFTESKIVVPASVSRSGQEIRFDGSRLGFFGHSQGGLNGPMYLAIDDSARGGVLSGSGSMISITLLEKTEPVNIVALVQSIFLGLTQDEIAELSPLHPAMSLAQTIVDPTDPIHYVTHIVRAPRSGFSPKSVLMTEGVNPDGTGDSYTPPHGTEVQSVALGLPLMQPVIHPIAELAYTDLPPVTIPPGGLSGNLADGAASGVLAQWPATKASDGHFVIYGIPAAMAQAAGFVRGFMDEPAGRVPPP